MNHSIFSPLAVLCALGALSSLSPDVTYNPFTDLQEEFRVEELPLQALNQDEADDDFFSIIDENSADLAEGEAADTPKPAPAHAHTPAKQAAPMAQKKPAPAAENTSFLSFGANYAYVSFKPHHNETFTGNLAGAEALYEYRPCNKIYGGLKLLWRQGETTSSQASRFLVDAVAEERLGYTWTMDEDRWLWTMFTGLGYRYLGHHLRQSGDILRLNYSEFYVPLALFTDYQVVPWFSWGVHATWQPQFFPTVTIIPLSGARWGLSNILSNILVETPLNFFAGKNQQFFLTVNPTFQYWRDGHSTAKTSTGEALGLKGISYLFWGVELSLGHAF